MLKRCFALWFRRWLAFALIACVFTAWWGANDAHAEQSDVRVAVLASGQNESLGDLEKAEALATLLEVALSETRHDGPSLTVLDRGEFAAVLWEIQLAVGLEGVPDASDVRLKFSPLDVERLLLVHSTTNIDSPAAHFVAHVIDTRTGLRVGSLPLDAGELDTDALERIKTLIHRPLETLTVLAISPAADARLTAVGGADGQRLQRAVAQRLQSPDRLQIEFGEARALATEMAVRGDQELAVHAQPHFVMLRIDDAGGEPDQLEVRAVLQHRQGVVADVVERGTPENLEAIGGRIAEHFEPFFFGPSADREDLVADLIARAKQVRATSQNREALELLETALLYEPRNVGLRAQAVELLQELIEREVHAVTEPLTAENRALLPASAHRIRAWHARGLEHLTQTMRDHIEVSDLDNRQHYRKFRHYPDRALRIVYFHDHTLRQWPELETLLSIPVTKATEDFKFHGIGLIDRHRARVCDRGVSVINWMYALVGRPGRSQPYSGPPENIALSEARILSLVRTLQELGPKQGKGWVQDAFNSLVSVQSEVTVQTMDRIIPTVPEPWLRYRLEGTRASAAYAMFQQSGVDRARLDEAAKRWPPGIELEVVKIPDVVKLSLGDKIKRASGYDTLPVVVPQRIGSDRLRVKPGTHARHAPCGIHGDLIYDRRAVWLLTPRGELRILTEQREWGDQDFYKIGNASFDGEHVWVLIPGENTKLLLIDPATGRVLTFDKSNGIPPSATGGSVVPLRRGSGIAFGSFGEGVNVRMWFAQIDLDGRELRIDVSRSAKSSFEADQDAPHAGRATSFQALHAHRLEVVRHPDDPTQVRVIAEASWRKYNWDAFYLLAIDPATRVISGIPDYSWDIQKEIFSSWQVAHSGRLRVWANVILVCDYDPFTSTRRLLKPPTSIHYEGLGERDLRSTPKGWFGVLDRYSDSSVQMGDPERDDALICLGRSDRSPVFPVARLRREAELMVVGWSESHGLLLKGDGLWAIPSAQVDAWPAPRFEIRDVAETPFFNTDAIRSIWGARARYIPLNSQRTFFASGVQWTFDEAERLATDYGTVLLGLEHLDDMKPLDKKNRWIFRIRDNSEVAEFRYWTALRADRPPGPIERDQLLPPDAKNGLPVVITPNGLVAVEPDTRHATVIPFQKLPKPIPQKSPGVPAVVEIPAGSARVGPLEQAPGELTPRQVTIPPGLWMMETELTNWHKIALLDPTRQLGDSKGLAWTPAIFRRTEDDIRRLCNRLNEITGEYWRLPTETEWEYACRAGTTTPYASGSDLAELRQIAVCDFDPQSPREQYVIRQGNPNAWGLYDMHGGAAEIVMHGRDPQRFRTWLAGTKKFPLELVLRGGSYADPPQRCTSYSRRPCQNVSWEARGVRLVLDRTGQPPTE